MTGEQLESLILLVIEVALAAIWIHGLVTWDGNTSCDESECDRFPFPCEKHNNK